MLFIFDLDHTLLNSEKFKKGLAKALKLSMEEFSHSYKKCFTDKKLPYNLDMHISAINNDEKVLLKNNVNEFLKKTDEYLFPEAANILRELKNNGHKLVLLTYGDIEWQKYKVENLKIEKCFDKIIYTNKKKSGCFFKKIIANYSTASNDEQFAQSLNDTVVIVNDNAKECLEMNKIFPDAEIFLIKSQYSNNAKHDFKIKKLKELIFMNI